MFNALLVNTVVGYGLEQCKTDPCVFRLMKDETVILTHIHINNVPIVNSNKSQYHGFIFHEAEHAWIGPALLKTVPYDRFYEKCVEPAACLPQPVRTLTRMNNLPIFLSKSRWEPHVNITVEVSAYKSLLHV